MLIIDESKRFRFKLNGETYTAYVRYYEGGDCDVELEGSSENPEAYEVAWAVAENKNLLSQPEVDDE